MTETVNEISLITSSILSKKLDEDLDCLIMDITCGRAAFMKNLEQANILAESLVKTCKYANKKCNAMIMRMEYPLGEMIGNTCEVLESIEAMDGSDPEYLDIV